MDTFITYLESLVDFIIANPGSTQGAAVDELQNQANVSNAVGNAFMAVLIQFYFDAGINNNNTWASFRNGIENADSAPAKVLLNAVTEADAIALHEDVAAVVYALANKAAQDRKVEIGEDLQIARDYRDALPTPPAIADNNEERVIRRAINAGIDALVQERNLIRS